MHAIDVNIIEMYSVVTQIAEGCSDNSGIRLETCKHKTETVQRKRPKSLYKNNIQVRNAFSV